MCVPGDSEALRRAFDALARFGEAAGLDRSYPLSGRRCCNSPAELDLAECRQGHSTLSAVRHGWLAQGRYGQVWMELHTSQNFVCQSA